MTGRSDTRRHLQASSSPAAAVAVDVILRDGSTLRLRAPARSDAGALISFFEGLSDQSLYLRFHGVRHVDAALVEHFLEPDPVDRGALVGVLARHGREEDRRGRRVRAAARSGGRRGRVHGRGRAAGPRRGDAPAGAARRARRPRSGSSRSWPRCSRERRDARGVPRRRVRGLAHARRRRGRGALPDRADGARSARASRSATTSRSPRRCGRSSRRVASP